MKSYTNVRHQYKEKKSKDGDRTVIAKTNQIIDNSVIVEKTTKDEDENQHVAGLLKKRANNWVGVLD